MSEAKFAFSHTAPSWKVLENVEISVSASSLTNTLNKHFFPPLTGSMCAHWRASLTYEMHCSGTVGYFQRDNNLCSLRSVYTVSLNRNEKKKKTLSVSALHWIEAPRQILKPPPCRESLVGRHVWHHLNPRPCGPCGTTGSVDTSSNNTQLCCCVKAQGTEEGGLVEHYAKICTISTGFRWASAAVVCAAPACLGSLRLQLGPHYVWQHSERAGIEAGMKVRKGGGSQHRHGAFSSSSYHGWINWCCFVHFFCWPSKRGGGLKGGGYSASCLWHGSYSLSLAHSVTITPPPPILMLLATASTQEMLCIHTHTHTASLSSKMHFSPAELWQWTVC